MEVCSSLLSVAHPFKQDQTVVPDGIVPVKGETVRKTGMTPCIIRFGVALKPCTSAAPEQTK